MLLNLLLQFPLSLQVSEYCIMENPNSFSSTCSICVLFLGMTGTAKERIKLIINKWALISWSTGVPLVESDYLFLGFPSPSLLFRFKLCLYIFSSVCICFCPLHCYSLYTCLKAELFSHLSEIQKTSLWVPFLNVNL